MSFLTSGAAVGGLLIGGGALASAGVGLYGSLSASQAQTNEEQQALAAQNQARSQLNPWINVGQGANYTLGSLYGIGQNGQPTNAPVDYSSFTNSPDYQFAQQQGNAALQNYENANGLAGSGGALAAASQYNQGLATQQYGNYFNRLMSLSQLGASSAQAGVSGANAAAQTMGAIGQSQASGITGATNAVSGGINSAVNNSLLFNAINKASPTAQTVNPSSYASTATPFQFPNAPFSAGSGG